MLRKDFFMEVKKTKGRFFSIFFIVVLGVAFYSGIRSSEPSMRMSGDHFFDRTDLMDVKVVSTLGLTDADVKAIEAVDGIGAAEGGYSKDVLCMLDGSEAVVHLMSMQQQFNELQVKEGRKPEKAGECLVDSDMAERAGLQIGDKLQVSAGGEETLSDSLTTDTFEIVGTGSSPFYVSFGRGSSSVGNGEVKGFLALHDTSFCMEVYTEIYAQVEGAKELTAFTAGYEALTEQAMDALKGIETERCQARWQEIVEEAEGELAEAEEKVEDESETLQDAKMELEESKSKAAKELAESKQKLLDAQKQLEESRQQIRQGNAQIQSGKKELERRQGELEAGEDQYRQGVEELNRQEQTLNQSEQQYLAEYARQMPLILAGKEKIQAAKQEIAAHKETLLTGKSQLLEQLEPMRTLADGLTKIREKKASLEEGLALGDAQYQEILALPEEQRTEEQSAFVGGWQTQKAELEGQKAMLEENEAALLGQLVDQFGSEEGFLTAKLSMEEKLSELEETEKELLEGEKGLLAQEKELQAGEQTLLSYGQQIQTGKAELAQAKEVLAKSRQKLDQGQEQIRSAWELLLTQETALEEGNKALISGEKELSEGWGAYQDGEAEATRKIAEGEAKISDGQEQLSKARQEIAEAKEEIAKIEHPKWYIQNREDALPDYEGFGSNADQMRALGQVFPVVFFLVAALISLTAMTRMVEEQRIQIGTLKALGYGKGAIAGKYIAYALTATVGGSIIGALLGEKIFPWIIIYVYQILYIHIPDITVPYHMSYAVQATAIAVACTLAATAAACLKELAAVPAQLMRPPAPKQGKRILLERMGFIWKHLSFIWKSSIRNLVRYKKRFFMTVFGIGGCMALMLVGFGLKDCIFEIPRLQYGELQIYDAAVYYDPEIQKEEEDMIVEQIESCEDVEESIQMRMQTLEICTEQESLNVYLTVADETGKVDDFLTFRSRTSGESYSLKEDRAILNEKAADILDVGPGDEITVKEEGLGERQVVVGAVCENYMGNYLYLSSSYYDELYDTQPDYNAVLYRMEDGREKEAEKVGQKLLKNEAVFTVSYTSTIEDQLGDMIRSLNLVVLVLIISAGMLAFVVLYNLNTINIAERRRELATIKVLGFYDQEVAAYVYRENIVLTLIGALAGMALGKFLLGFVIATVEVERMMFGRTIQLKSYLYCFILTVGFSMIVNFVMYFKLKRIDMVESLKSVE